VIISFYNRGVPQMGAGPRRVLVVEDDRDIASLVQLHLAEEGCEVTIAHDGSQGLLKALSEPYDLLILDLMLPGTDGIEICRRVRSRPDYTPILMLTAKSAEPDRIVGLEMGADDYLTKPFSVRELLARIRALFRRIAALAAKEAKEAPNRIAVGGLTITLDKRRVELDGRIVELTAKEFDLLAQFASHPGRVYTRSELLDLVWGYGQDSYQHTVNSHINRLRAKIERDPAEPHYVRTVWGVGYKFLDPADAT
jgi:DNA-binding response OmpR family regulator